MSTMALRFAAFISDVPASTPCSTSPLSHAAADVRRRHSGLGWITRYDCQCPTALILRCTTMLTLVASLLLIAPSSPAFFTHECPWLSLFPLPLSRRLGIQASGPQRILIGLFGTQDASSLSTMMLDRVLLCPISTVISTVVGWTFNSESYID